MLNVLVPVDGTSNALGAVRHALREYQQDHNLRLHLLNVQPALSRHVARFLSRGDRQRWHRDQARAALAPAERLLAQAGVPVESHWGVGQRAREICRQAIDLKVHHIVMGTARKSSLTRLLEDSVTNRVLETTPVPVEVIVGQAVSRWERLGLPLGLGLSLGSLAWMALD